MFREVLEYIPADTMTDREIKEIDGKRYLTSSSKRKSQVRVKNSSTRTIDVYEDTGIVIGEGRYGIVRKFINQHGDALAVKSFKDKMTFTAYLAKADDLNFASWSNRSATPFWRGFFFQSECREVMPLFPGKIFSHAALDCTSEIELLSLMIDVAVELSRIHARDIVHGDLYEANILAEKTGGAGKHIVHYVDFSHANFIGEKNIHWCLLSFCEYLAPETIDNNKGSEANFYSVHPSQDIYSFASMIQRVVLKNKNLDLLISVETKQMLLKLVEQSLSTDPEKRSTINEWIKAMKTRSNEIKKSLEAEPQQLRMASNKP